MSQKTITTNASAATIAQIKFVGEASPLKTEARIRREVGKALNDGSTQHYTPEWTEAVDVTEDAEKCGYGPLHIRGTVSHWNGYSTLTYRIENNGSLWRNHGAPNGTRHAVSIALHQI